MREGKKEREKGERKAGFLLHPDFLASSGLVSFDKMLVIFPSPLISLKNL